MLHIAPLPHTPIGTLWLAQRADGALLDIHFHTTETEFAAYIQRRTGQMPVLDEAALAPAAEQLRQYFAAERRTFTLPLAWDTLSDFQHRALRLVDAIPYGKTRTYLDIARDLGAPQAVRAVGRANATNPLPIIIPCHRVLGTNGKLHGYGGGLEAKALLLRLEGSWLI